MTMTVAQYITPHGTVIQAHGLQPDIPVKTSNAYLNYITNSIVESASVSGISNDIINKADSILKTCVP